MPPFIVQDSVQIRHATKRNGQVQRSRRGRARAETPKKGDFGRGRDHRYCGDDEGFKAYSCSASCAELFFLVRTNREGQYIADRFVMTTANLLDFAFKALG